MPIPTPHTSVAVLAIIAAFSGVGFYVARRIKAHTLSEFFLAGGTVHWSLLAAVLLGLMVWGLVVLDLATPAAIGGNAVWIPLCGLAAGVLLLGRVVLPLRSEARSSLVSHLSARYGRNVGLVVAVVWVGFSILVRIPLTILIGGRLLHASLGWDQLQASLLLVALPGLLVVTRGYVSVLIGYAAAGALAAATAVGLLVVGIPPSFMVAVSNPSLESIPMPAVIAASLVFGFWYSCADQGSLHHAIAARNQGAIRLGSLVAAIGLIALGGVVITTGPDGIAHAATVPDDVMVVLIGSASFLLAVATLSSHYVAVANIIGCDIYHVARPEKDEGSVLLVSRAVTAVVVISAILAGATLGLMGIERVDWFLRALAVIAPPLAAIVLIGRFWERMQGRGALWGLSIGWAGGGIWSLILANSVADVCFGTIGTFLATAMVLAVVSLASVPASVRQEAPRTYGQRDLRSHRP